MSGSSSARSANHAKASVFSRVVNQAGMLLFVALVPAVLAAVFHPRKPAWSRERMAAPDIEVAQILRWEGRVLFVDARGEADYQEQHILSAVRLSEEQWEEQLPVFLQAWQPRMRVVVYCGTQNCDLSQSVARRLRRDTGIDEIFVLKGGWDAWLEARKQRN